jgi:hypothetical protein
VTKTKRVTVPAEALLGFLRTLDELPADARIVGTGWGRVFDEAGKPFAREAYFYVESATYESDEEPGV